MAKKFIDDKNIERILAAIDEKYLDKNEYYSILNNTTSPTDEYLQFVRDGDIVYSFNGSRPVQVDIRAFTGRDGVDGKDGKDAVNQVVSFVFCRSKDGIPDPPSGGEFINTLPNRPLGSDGTCIWKDVPQGEGTTYMSKRMFSSDGNHDSAWSDPIVWQDSADFQVEYSADYTPGTHKDGLPSFNSYYKNYSTIIDVEQRASAAELAWRETCRSNGYGTWSDEVENPKYMATCSLKDGVWSDWSITQIQGENGISQYEYIIYKRSHTKPTETFNNSEGSYNNPHPTFNGNNSLAESWTESIPEGLGRLWRVSRTYVSAGNNGKWSDIILWEDRPGFQVEYSSDYDPSKGDLPLFDTFYQAADNIEAAEGAWRSKCKNLGFGTWSDSSNNAKYMATCSLKDGSWTAWTATQIVGESSEHLELTNEFDQIYVNEDNKPIAGQTWSTDLKFFIGTTEHTITSEPTVISSYPNISYSFIKEENKITGINFNLNGSAAIDSNAVNIDISYNGHTKTLTLKKFKGTDDYDIWASSTYYKVDKTGNTTTPQIEINIAKSKVGQESGVEYLDQVPEGFKLVYKSIIDDKESEICTMSADSAILEFIKNPDQTDACYLNPNYDGIKIELLKDNDLYDFVYIEKLLDGQGDPGISSFLSSVYTRSYQKPARPVGGNYNDSTPTGCDPNQVAQGLADVKWTDGILAGDLPLWCSQRTFYSIDNDPSDNVWSDPFLLVDSQYFQVEYAPEGANTSLKNFGPYYVTANGDIKEAETLWRVDHADWSDTTENAFWMATCRNVKDSKTNETSWTDWQVTRIAGEKGDPGVAAEWTDYRYHASTSYTDAPEMSDLTNINGPTGWTKSPNSSPIAPYIWVTTAKKTWDSEKNKEIFKDENGQWSTPYCSNASGKDGISISTVTEYYLATNKSTGVTTDPNLGWTTTIQTITKDKPYLWNYEKITYDRGKQPTETIPVIIGTYGQDGDPGKGIQSITEYYALNNDPNTKPTGYGTNPTNNWSTTPKVSTPTARYLWNFEVITWTVGNPTYTDPVIIGVHGEKGEDGNSGLAKVPYYAGVVKADQSYTASEYATPYVTDAEGKAYVLIANQSSGNKLNDESEWAKMDQFSAIFASLALIDNGTVGDAVFNNGYMFSKKGQIYTYDAGGSIGIRPSEDYSKFIPYESIDRLLGEDETDFVEEEKFVPSLLFNFKDGSGYLNNGDIRFDSNGVTIAGKTTIEKGVTINADIKIGDFSVTEIGTGSNKTSFVFANNGTWGYDLVTGNRVNKLRAYVKTTEPIIKVNLSDYDSNQIGNRILEGCILTSANKSIQFEGTRYNIPVDQYGVLQYVAISDDNGRFSEGMYTVHPLNQIIRADARTYELKSVHLTGFPSYAETVLIHIYSGQYPICELNENLSQDPNQSDARKYLNFTGQNLYFDKKPDSISISYKYHTSDGEPWDVEVDMGTFEPTITITDYGSIYSVVEITGDIPDQGMFR